MFETVQQEATFGVAPTRVYEILMDEGQHGAFTGGVAKISQAVGGEFSCHDGQIVGVNVELVPGRRIVQAWRVAAWPAGLWSLVTFELSAAEEGTHLALTHTGLPPGAGELISKGWQMRYWAPMKALLG